MKNQRMLGVLDLILGILLFLAGFHALTHPMSALAGVVVFYGLLAVITGIVDVVFYVKMERRTGFGPVVALVSGILSIFTGILVLTRPAAGGISLAILLPIWFISHCISELARLPLLRWTSGTRYYYFTLIVGLMMLFSPGLSILSLPWMAGIYLLLLGLNSIVLGLQKLISRR